MYCSISTGWLKSACKVSIRSISSLMLPTRALKPMPMEPSSRTGLTMTGKSMSSAQSTRPRKTVTKSGVWIP